MNIGQSLYDQISSLNLPSFSYLFLDILQKIELKDFFDIFLTSAFLFIFFYVFKKTRVIPIISSIFLIIFLIYGLSYWLNLYTTLTLIKLILGSIIVISAIVFQKEIRRFFEIVNVSKIRKQIENRGVATETVLGGLSEVIVHTLGVMTQRKIGALIIIPQNESVDSLVTGGFSLDGKVSEPLLLSIFDTSSPGHDGAIILEKDIIKKFGVFLPLSEKDDAEELKKVGTRHRAALGLSERTDAIVIVVSEERGTISIAKDGKLKIIENNKKLINFLDEIFGFNLEQTKHSKKSFWGIFEFLGKNIKQIILSLFLGCGLWLLISYSNSSVIQKTYDVSVAFNSNNETVLVENIKPAQVSLVFLGKESDFQFVNQNEVRVIIDLNSLELSASTSPYHSYVLKDSNVKYPSNISLKKIEPSIINFKISQNNFKK